MYRQGELIIVKTKKVKGKKLPHLILAEGEATGHRHEVTTGDAELYEHEGTLFLSVKSKEALLTHPDHKPLPLPMGNFEIITQREYVIGDEKYQKVVD